MPEPTRFDDAPTNPVFVALRTLGIEPPLPPSVRAVELRESIAIWTAAGLQDVETRQIAVERPFADFEEFWSTCLVAPTLGPRIAAMPSARAPTLKAAVRSSLAPNDDRPLPCHGRANAIRGTVPG